jgi:hypothetical protein
MLTPQTITPFYQNEVRPVLANSDIPVEARKELAFRYVELRTSLTKLSIREVNRMERNLRALIKELNGRARA